MKRWTFVAVLVCILPALAPALAGQQRPGAQSPAPASSLVTADRLVNAETEPHNWLMYSGDYKSRRYSGLDQIDKQNVADLEVQWILPAARTRSFRYHSARRRRDDVHHRITEYRHRSRCREWTAILAIRSSAARRAQFLLRAEQPRCRHFWRPAVHEHDGCPRGGP